MKYLPLVWAGLWRKPMRTIFTFLSIAAAFILVGILFGLGDGFDHVLATSRMDRLFADPRFGGRMPVAYAERIAAVPGVIVVAPRSGIPVYYKDPKNRSGVIMTDSRFFETRPELTATPADKAALDRDPTALIVTEFAARQYGWKVGDTIPLVSSTATIDGSRTWIFHLIAVIDDSGSPGVSEYLVGNYKYLDQRRSTDKGTADRFLMLIRDPNQASQTARAIDKLFANSPQPTRTESERTQDAAGLRSLGDISFFIHAIVAALLFMLLFLTGNTMMQSVRERIPEFAVLKTLGFSDTGLLALVVGEALLLCLLAGAAGLAIIQFAGRYYSQIFPDVAGFFLMTWPAFFTGLGFALVTALIAGLPPAWRVAHMNVVDALRR